jgi:hypothetical protein
MKLMNVGRFALLLTAVCSASSCTTVVTPRLPVPLPLGTVAVGGLGLASAGVGPEGDSLGGYTSVAVGGSVAAAVADGWTSRR